MRSKVPAAVLLLALVAACSGGKAVVKASPTASPTPSPTPKAAARPKPALDPLTGTAPRSTAPVVAIKVDNAFLARPYQTGLGRAAVVYEELVEGGSTRLLAVFESDLTGNHEVGPIRSVRESDVELLREYGSISVGFSGGNSGVKAIIASAARSGWLVDASYDVIPGAYRLGAQRADARNFFAVPSALATRRPGNGPRDIGLRFGPLARGGAATALGVANYSGQSRVTVRYSAATHSWSVSQDGRLMGGVAPANIIIQRVVERGSRFSDVHGMPTPYTVTAGSGSAVVLRDGKRFAAKWTRTNYGATHYRNAAGKEIALRAGKTWVLLVPTSGSVSFG
ncbi:MAG: CchlO [Frankiales bacterium]|nr:CchlO [Frankiales bacterium]